MKTNQQLMQDARGRLSGNWETPIVSYLVAELISGIGGPIGLVIGGPMQFGVSVFSLRFARGKNAEVTQIFDGFKTRISESIVAYLLTLLYVALWSLLLIIPGIVAAIAYSQTFFILADDDKVSGTEAMARSQKMMSGNKWRFFCLGLRFTGWFILCLFTFGIGFLWLVPYMQVTLANFYYEVK